MKVVIIYNPNSTGGSKENAMALATELRAKNITVLIKRTTHPKHGEEIAASYAQKNEKCILISSSGDGGYHEVVNGVLAHQSKNLIVGVLPSGNANDHASALSSDSLAKAIEKKKFHHIDTIQVTATVNGESWTRYAHSYVGMGVTASTAKRLTVDRPNVFSEKWIVAHSLFSFRYVRLKENNKVRRYSSKVFGNINRMSKVIKLSDNSSVTDGKFEMSSIRFRSKFRLLAYLITAATIGLKDTRSLSKYNCKTIRRTPIQLDGEVYVIDANSAVAIRSIKQNLHCVL